SSDRKGVSSNFRECAYAVLAAAMPTATEDFLAPLGDALDSGGNLLSSWLWQSIVQLDLLDVPKQGDARWAFGASLADAALNFRAPTRVGRFDDLSQHLSPNALNDVIGAVAAQRIQGPATIHDPACGTCGTLAKVVQHARAANPD